MKKQMYLLYNLNKMKKERLGILCLDCGWVRVSWSVHDYRTCPCPNQTMIDGGDDYLRCGAMNLDRTQIVRVTPVKERKKK